MKKKIVLCVLCLFFAVPGAIAEKMASADNLLPVVVLLYDEASEDVSIDLLLIVIHKSTGRAMKVTLPANQFVDEMFDATNTESHQALLKNMEEVLQIPLEKYVCIGMDALRSLEPGKAKEMGAFDLIGLGLSLIGSTQTNLSIGETVQTFQLAFSEKEEGIEVALPENVTGGEEVLEAEDWAQIRAVLRDVINDLGLES